MIAVVGCGGWGKNIVRNLAELGVLSGVCDAQDSVAKEISRAYAIPALTLEQIEDDPQIVGCVIAVPSLDHARLGERMLEAGKHVLIEKPLTLSLDDAKRLNDISKTQKRILMVGHILHYHPAVAVMLAWNAKNPPLTISSTRLGPGKVYPEEDVFWNLACHDLSVVLAMMPDPPRHILAVAHGDGGHQGTVHMAGDRCCVHIRVSRVHPFRERKMVVFSADGALVFDDLAEHKLTFYTKDGSSFVEEIAKDEPLRAECLHFIECIRDGTQPRTNGEEGMRVVSILEHIRQSLHQKAWVSCLGEYQRAS